MNSVIPFRPKGTRVDAYPARNPFTRERQTEQDLTRERMLLEANPRIDLMWATSRCPECDFDQEVASEHTVKVCGWCGVARD